MQPEIRPMQEVLHQRIADSLHKAENRVVGLRKTHTLFIIGGLVSSALATLVAGGTVLQGPLVGAGIPGWRIACTVAAILSFISTLSVGIEQQLKFGAHLLQGQLCVARLRAIEGALALGSRAWEEISKDYEEILKGNAEVLS